MLQQTTSWAGERESIIYYCINGVLAIMKSGEKGDIKFYYFLPFLDMQMIVHHHVMLTCDIVMTFMVIHSSCGSCKPYLFPLSVPPSVPT